MRVNKRGQVTIPAELRRRYGLTPGTEVHVVADDTGIRILKGGPATGRGRAIAEFLRGRATRRDMTSDEIMALMRGDDWRDPL